MPEKLVHSFNTQTENLAILNASKDIWDDYGAVLVYIVGPYVCLI